MNEILGNNYHCKKDISFSEFEVIHFNFIVQYVDVLNYKNPNDKFFYRIETKIEKDNYSVNHLNFFPSLVKTNKGIIFDNYQEEISYVYDRDDVFTYTYDKNEIYMSYYLWLNNKMCYFERIYKKIQDVLSDIGGVSGPITFIAAYLNKLYNDYVILSDIKLLLSPYFNTEDDKKKNNNISFKNLNYKSNNIESSKTVVDIGMNSEKNKNTIPSESNIQNTENNKVLYEKKYGFENNININNKNTMINDKISFWSYLYFSFKCKQKNNDIIIYEIFRKKIISEEHIIKDYLNVYNMLWVLEKEGINLNNTYHFKDLINNG